MSTNEPTTDRSPDLPQTPVASPPSDRTGTVVPKTDVGDADADEVYRCPYCDRPFRTIRLKTLHVGEVHDDRATAEEREVFEKATEMEADDLFFFHIKIVIALGVLYSTSVIGYTVVIGLLG